MIAAYIRVSSKAQDLGMQRHAIEKSAAARGEKIDVWYAEKQSAKTTDRPELKRLRGESGLYTRVYVYRLDRFARTGIRDTLDVLESIRATGCKVTSVADGFDLDGVAAEIIIAVIAWAAKMERLAINERIAGARERMEAEGLPWGRPPKMSAQERETAIRLKQEGKSTRYIAQALGVKRTTLRRALASGVQPDRA